MLTIERKYFQEFHADSFKTKILYLRYFGYYIGRTEYIMSDAATDHQYIYSISWQMFPSKANSFICI